MTETAIDWSHVPLRPVTTRRDEALPGLLDIYQKSFPVEEQVLVSFFLKTLAEKERGEAENLHLIVLAQGEEVAGFAFYEIGEEVENRGKAAYLWYIAVNPKIRGGGIGKRLYHHVLEDVFTANDCRILFYEIEQGDDVAQKHGPESAKYAAWRKNWYKKLGAQELVGVHYLCSVDWQPPVPMDVLVHLRDPMTASEVLEVRPSVLDDEITVVGELRLE